MMCVEVVVLCGGAANPALEQIPQWISQAEQVFYVGIDRGALRLVEAGYILDLAIGDFDSVSQEELQVIRAQSRQMQLFASEKDDTDTELAFVMAHANWPNATYVALGLLGEGSGRVDHLLANIWLAHQPRFQPMLRRLWLVEAQHCAQFLLPDQHELSYRPNYYLSIISLTPVEQIQIQHAKYTLPMTDLAYPQALISNEYLPNHAAISLSFVSGIILVVWVNRL